MNDVIETDSTIVDERFLDSLPEPVGITAQDIEWMQRLVASLPDGPEDPAIERLWDAWLAERPSPSRRATVTPTAQAYGVWEQRTTKRITMAKDGLIGPEWLSLTEIGMEEAEHAYISKLILAHAPALAGASDRPRKITTLAEVAADRARLDGLSREMLVDLRREAAYLVADVEHALMGTPATATATPEPASAVRAAVAAPRMGMTRAYLIRDVIKRRETARLITRGDQVIVTDLIFHRDGKPVGDIRKAWAKACIKAGLFHVERDEAGKEIKVPEKLFHDFRRTAVRNLVRSGIDPTIAREITGHRTSAVFSRYNIVSENDLRRAMQQRAVYEEGLRK